MRTIDLSPLYRSMVGVDRMIDLIDAATRADAGASGYPPFNIKEQGEDSYRIELAVAGFSDDDLTVEVTDDTLVVSGAKPSGESDETYLHRGIAQRAFERRFKLADHVLVTGAALENGLLIVDLKREVPEAKKPRRIAIGVNGANGKLIEG
ncbi:MAG: Hsp20 family protein [Caulobacterales bacterium]|nr:Hsp20 family protein [Caulobacterales bacterium]